MTLIFGEKIQQQAKNVFLWLYDATMISLYVVTMR